MNGLNYLGDSTGPETMASAAPGLGPITGAPQGPAGPSAPPRLSMGAPPGALPGLPSFFPPAAGGEGLSLDQYTAVTQENGTVALHLLKPDGSLGPVLQVISVKNPKGQKPGDGQQPR